MKKNNYIKNGILAVTVSLSMLTGCNDFLEIDPPSDISPETYLWTESDLAAYTIDRYHNSDNDYIFRSVNGSGGDGLYLDDRATDVMTNRGSNNRFTPGEWKVGSTGGSWGFGNIYQLNYFLQTVLPRYQSGELTGNIDNVKHYIGEAYVLRAFEYFGKLKALGDFPIITRTIPDNKDSLVVASQRKPRNEVARFILSDLDKAIDLLKETPPNGERTRISKPLAYLIKSRVALFEATWLKYHKGTALVPNGQGWPGASKAYNANYQFPSGSIDGEIEFFLQQAMSSAKQVADNIALTSNSKIIRQSASDPSNPYYEMFASEDLSSYDEVLLWRDFDLTLGNVQYWNHYLYYGNGYGYTRQFVDGVLMENGLPIYAAGSGYQGDDFVGDVKVNRDWRLKLFMRAPGETKAFVNLPEGTSPEVEPEVPVIDGSSRYMEGTGYSIKKGLSYDNEMQATVGRDVTAVVCFRAVEAYLNYMEACYELNGSLDADAQKYWRAIRERAGVDADFNKTIAATDMNQEALNDWGAYSHGQLVDATLYNIRRERKVEMAVEGLRYMDLTRWRAMDQLSGYKIEGIKVWGPMKDVYGGRLLYGQSDATKNTVSDPALSDYLRIHQISPNNFYYNGYNFTEAHYLNPIAAEHFIISSPDGQTPEDSPIYQNPGWTLEGNQPPVGY
ncbi:putative outer membrane starch-binding protein [Mangrovibacterium marinum]|uniref:Putative outer membrane starch-binding protein n=1 Tax=Mangrovibacterium marinum TaxID=1639118 RepID=A0A2T5C0D8_9BACT|nr:RagB/SusD family nutrient uptake outer membrane protein [Mangrovibacterium marinum]PTN08018.1 putative outer membrane starch-binding protein [Mangrovibacterium marinum]